MSQSLKHHDVAARVPFIWFSQLFSLIFLAVLSWDASAALPSAEETPGAGLQKAFLSFRIGHDLWSDESRFIELIAIFRRHPAAIDEMTFFTQTTHTPIPDDELTRRCELLKVQMEVARQAGLKAGINILCTIGHHPEDMGHVIGAEIPRAMTISGRIAEGTLCMNTEPFKERIRRIYSVMCRANPDYIWIDDDVRVGHMINSAGEGGATCFCDTCIARCKKSAPFGLDRFY